MVVEAAMIVGGVAPVGSGRVPARRQKGGGKDGKQSSYRSHQDPPYLGPVTIGVSARPPHSVHEPSYTAASGAPVR
jgi:hypothetical protein